MGPFHGIFIFFGNFLILMENGISLKIFIGITDSIADLLSFLEDKLDFRDPKENVLSLWTRVLSLTFGLLLDF